MQQGNGRRGAPSNNQRRAPQESGAASHGSQQQRRRQPSGQARATTTASTRTNGQQRSRRSSTSQSPNRAAGVAPTPRGANRHASRSRQAYKNRADAREEYMEDEWYEEEPGRRGVRVPLIPALFVLILCVGATAFATRYLVLRTHGLAQTGVTASQAASQQADGGTNAQTSSVATTVDQDTSNYSNTEESTADSTNSNDSASTNDSTSTSTSSTSSTTNESGSFTAKAGNGVKDPWLKSGVFSSGDETLDEEVKTFCDGIANTDMDLATAALEVYKGVAWSEYVERDDAQHPAGPDWRIEYARKYYEHDCSGNCYEFASFLSFCLQYLGYTDAHAEGVLIEKQSGDWGDHGLVFVTNLDGTPSLCDTSKGTDGWMLKDTVYNIQMQDFESA